MLTFHLFEGSTFTFEPSSFETRAKLFEATITFLRQLVLMCPCHRHLPNATHWHLGQAHQRVVIQVHTDGLGQDEEMIPSKHVHKQRWFPSEWFSEHTNTLELYMQCVSLCACVCVCVAKTCFFWIQIVERILHTVAVQCLFGAWKQLQSS